ncbi:Ion transport protein [Popillia japonica]|uniref:Ion transport protein n=1 Tax=Popillia japonica TaxID=7064 RepID=A0AAW1LB81_POPJA
MPSIIYLIYEDCPSQRLLMLQGPDYSADQMNRMEMYMYYRGQMGQYFVYEDESDVPRIETREWKLQSFHYDDVAMAMLTLFAVQTGEGWPAVLQHSMSATYEDQGPIQNFRIEMSIFYIVYFVVFPFFFVNIFVALIIITFQEQGEAELQSGEIDKNQKSCIDFAIQARPLERYMPNKRNSFKYKIWRLVVSTPFEYFIMMLIVFNTLLLMMKYHESPPILSDTLAAMNIVFTFLFLCETVLKLIAFGIKVKLNFNFICFVC